MDGSLSSFEHKTGNDVQLSFFGMSKFAHLLTVCMVEVPCFFNFSAYKHLNLPNVWSWHTYTHSRAPILCHLLTNSSRQYHLQILIMRRWFNWVRMWPTKLYRVLKWRQTKPISLWDTDYLILLRVLSWEIVCSCICLVLFCTGYLLYMLSFVHSYTILSCTVAKSVSCIPAPTLLALKRMNIMILFDNDWNRMETLGKWEAVFSPSFMWYCQVGHVTSGTTCRAGQASHNLSQSHTRTH